MKKILAVGCFVLSLAYVGWASADVTWDKSPATDIKDYRVFACFTPSCTVEKTDAMLQATVTNVPALARQVYVVDLTGKEGTFKVTARDLTGNESGLSVAAPFDRQAPPVPVNPIAQ